MRLLPAARPGTLIAVTGLIALGLCSAPTAAQASPAAVAGAAVGKVRHFNVEAPHSPRLMHALAGPAARGSSPIPGVSAGSGLPTATPVPTGPPGAARGVDVAAFQHPTSTKYPDGAPINWSQVAGSGIQFAAIKATEGNYYVNPFYARDLTGASEAGLAVIAYAFANPAAGNGTAADQAQYLVDHAGKVADRTPTLMLDVEYNPYSGGECYGLTPAAMVTWISTFVTEARSLTGQTPILYSTEDWWAKCTGASTAFASDPMWDAAYTTATTPPLPLPAGWGTWSLWQYTSSGTVPGIATAGSTDLDALNLISPAAQQATVGQGRRTDLEHAFRCHG